MIKFEITDHELGSVAAVKGVGVAEMMHDYLPWAGVDLNIKWCHQKCMYNITDNNTDFKYEVRVDMDF